MNDLRILIKYTSFLGVFALLIIWISQPFEGKYMKKNTSFENTYNPQRHLVLINLDSLMTLFNQVNTDRYYEFERNKDELHIKVIDKNHILRFQKKFLDSKTIEYFTQIKEYPVKKLKRGDGIRLPVKKHDTINFVEIPVEILQSILKN